MRVIHFLKIAKDVATCPLVPYANEYDCFHYFVD